MPGIKQDLEYERTLIKIARAIYEFVDQTKSGEQLKDRGISEIYDAWEKAWKNHRQTHNHHLDPSDDLARNLNNFYNLKEYLVNFEAYKHRYRSVGITPELIEELGEDTRAAIEELEQKLEIM